MTILESVHHVTQVKAVLWRTMHENYRPNQKYLNIFSRRSLTLIRGKKHVLTELGQALLDRHIKAFNKGED